MWIEGKSATMIALELGGGVTKNAVIGKVHRLNLGSHGTNYPVAKPKRIAAVRPAKGRGQPKAAALRHRVAVAPKLAVREPAPAGGIVLLDLGRQHCRWPLWGMGAPEEYRFCGATRDHGSSYCEVHRHLSVNHRVAEVADAIDA
jgi:GcrA cell cycle regulator